VTSKHVTELLSAYLDGELSQEERTRVESHLEHCAECQQELAGFRRTIRLVRSLPQLELPEDYHADLRRRLLVDSMGEEQRERGSGRSRGLLSGLLARVGTMRRASWAGLAAAALVIVVVVATAGSGLFGPASNLLQFGGVATEDSAPMEPGESIRASYGLEGSKSPMGEPDMTAQSEEAEAPDYKATAPSTTPRAAADVLPFDRKIIRTAQFDIEVEDSHKAYQQVVVMAETMGGFVQESNQQADGDRMRAYLIIRVPVNGFSRAVEELGTLGTITNQRMSGQDVTEEYYDMESRVKTLQAKESSLMQLLGQATTVDDILKVERELWSVREQIEQLQGRMRYYDNLTSLATLQVNLYEPQPIPPDEEPDSLLDQLLEALINSVKYLGYYATRLLVAITWVLPYAAIVLAIWWVVRWAISRRS